MELTTYLHTFSHDFTLVVHRTWLRIRTYLSLQDIANNNIYMYRVTQLLPRCPPAVAVATAGSCLVTTPDRSLQYSGSESERRPGVGGAVNIYPTVLTTVGQHSLIINSGPRAWVRYSSWGTIRFLFYASFFYKSSVFSGVAYSDLIVFD